MKDIAEQDFTEENEFTEYKVIEKHSTKCNHSWKEEGTNLNMISVVCDKCWSGAQFDPNEIKLENGKLTNK